MENRYFFAFSEEEIDGPAYVDIAITSALRHLFPTALAITYDRTTCSGLSLSSLDERFFFSHGILHQPLICV